MTLFYEVGTHPDPQFISAGTFIGNTGWQHERRIIDSYEIICLIHGTLPLQIADVKYMAAPGTFLIVPPHVEHQGFRPIREELKFDWFHFSLPTLKAARQPDQLAERLGDLSFLLPGFSEQLFMDRIYVISNQLLDVYEMKGSQQYLNCILSCILYEVTMQTCMLLRTQTMNPHELQPVRDWIRIHALGHINLTQIAEYFNYNKSYLSRIYKQKFGLNITQEIERFRIDAAKSMLVETDSTVEGISALVGYNDDKYFMKVFKKNTGMTPTHYRMTFHQRHFNML